MVILSLFWALSLHSGCGLFCRRLATISKEQKWIISDALCTGMVPRCLSRDGSVQAPWRGLWFNQRGPLIAVNAYRGTALAVCVFVVSWGVGDGRELGDREKPHPGLSSLSLSSSWLSGCLWSQGSCSPNLFPSPGIWCKGGALHMLAGWLKFLVAPWPVFYLH